MLTKVKEVHMIFSLQLCFISEKDIPGTLRIDEYTEFVFTNHGKYYEKSGLGTTQGNIFELSIQYSDQLVRNHIIDLFCAAYTVVAAYNHYDLFELLATPLGDSKFSACQGDDEAYSACLLVQKCYNNQKYKNAICKDHVAHETYTLHPMDLHPINEPIERNTVLTENIRIANVVIACYSILEELGLQIIIKKLDDGTNESSVTPDGKSWNTEVLERLKSALFTNGINPDTDIMWLSRNGIPRPFKYNVVDTSNPCEWNDGDAIKDFNIKITDAILELSYMRSRLASHGVGDRVLELTIYDVDNAFHLTRIVLLDFFKIKLM